MELHFQKKQLNTARIGGIGFGTEGAAIIASGGEWNSNCRINGMVLAWTEVAKI